MDLTDVRLGDKVGYLDEVLHRRDGIAAVHHGHWRLADEQHPRARRPSERWAVI